MTSSSTWVLVADAQGARIFRFVDKNDEWTLHETLRWGGGALPGETTDFGSKASEHKGALHAHGEPSAKETQERRFAHDLARMLEKAHREGAFAKLALVAPPKLLGDLRENLNRGLHDAIVAEFHKDYTHSPVKELMTLLRADLPV